ncbi:CDP-6-deoxy-delta-3,4-glucoseen reductase [Kaarinaea lacus]
MSFTIKVEPSGHTFTVEDDEPVLNAALRHGLNFPYGCRDGHCGTCKARLMKGEVHYPGMQTGALSDEERISGIALLCQAQPLSDLQLQVHLVASGNDIQVKKLPCRVQKKQLLADDVVELTLKLPVTERLPFLAGQYIDILLSDGRRRSFSIANAPHDDEFIILHIRHIDGGDFTGYVFDQLQEKSILRIEGPLGGFYLREDSDRPMIFVAGGTGFAPIKSIIEHALAQEIIRPMHFYWGARAKRDLYQHRLAEHWAQNNNNVIYTPVLSDSSESDQWTGRSGWVHDAVLTDFADLSGYDVYASGPPAMVTAASEAFIAKGLSKDRFFSDAFEYQTPKNP